MKSIFSLTPLVLFVGYSIWHSFTWWFRPKESLAANERIRNRYKKTLFWVDFHSRDPGFEIWLNRILGMFFLLWSALMIFLEFYSSSTIRQ
jgi:hypothetical protein